MFDRDTLSLLQEALGSLEAGADSLPPFEPEYDREAIRAVLRETADRLRDNFPYGHPLYAGQMLKPPHPVARLAYQLAQHINPNNHALDGGRASSAMEKEAVAEIAFMFGWNEYLGHLTGGGTMANLEALWVAGELQGRDSTVLASAQAHYTHERICGVLGLPFESVPADRFARMDAKALRDLLERGGVGTVVATLGTTATGSVDPLHTILELRDEFGVRIHVDAAYGGYFILTELSGQAEKAFARIGEADSIVIDPHKHGLQPYGCGCVLFRDRGVGALYKHDSPYTYFSSAELHLGEISLECSRPGAAAVALWATQRLMPLARGGEFATRLGKSLRAASNLYGRLLDDPRFHPAFPPELDIVVWSVRAATLDESSRLARRIFQQAAKRDLHLALANLPVSLFGDPWGAGEDATVTCLRSCLMKPEHESWLDEIWARLNEATDTCLDRGAV